MIKGASHLGTRTSSNTSKSPDFSLPQIGYFPKRDAPMIKVAEDVRKKKT